LGVGQIGIGHRAHFVQANFAQIGRLGKAKM